MRIVSYMTKENKALLLLTTNHVTPEIPPKDFKGRDNKKNKSTINLFYNSTKGGVDVIDYMCRVYSAKRGTKRWTMSLFGTMIDIAAINAQTCSLKECVIPDKITRRKDFLLYLAMELIVPYIYERPTGTLQQHVLDGANTIIKTVNKYRSQRQKISFITNTLNKTPLNFDDEEEEDEEQQQEIEGQEIGEQQQNQAAALLQNQVQSDPTKPKKSQICYLCPPRPNVRNNMKSKFFFLCQLFECCVS